MQKAGATRIWKYVPASSTCSLVNTSETQSHIWLEVFVSKSSSSQVNTVVALEKRRTIVAAYPGFKSFVDYSRVLITVVQMFELSHMRVDTSTERPSKLESMDLWSSHSRGSRFSTTEHSLEVPLYASNVRNRRLHGKEKKGKN
jgi:hypothetical protein